MTVVLRKAFGGAFIAMNSRDLGADLVLAWPRAQIGVMGPKQAVDLVHRREIAAATTLRAARERLAAAYADEHLTAGSAAAEGVDRRDRAALGHARPHRRRAPDPGDPRPPVPTRPEHPL